MNDDLISRSALRKAVNDFYDNSFKGIVSSDLIKYAEAVDDFIDNAPTVDTTFRELVAYECGKNDRPKGKWIEYDEDELYTGECSCCKWKALLYESNVLNMNFCPNCGADMRGDV